MINIRINLLVYFMYDSFTFRSNSQEYIFKKCQKTIDEEVRLGAKMFEDLRIECENEYGTDVVDVVDVVNVVDGDVDNSMDGMDGDNCYSDSESEETVSNSGNYVSDSRNYVSDPNDYIEHTCVSVNLNKIKELLDVTLQLTKNNKLVMTIMDIVEQLREYES